MLNICVNNVDEAIPVWCKFIGWLQKDGLNQALFMVVVASAAVIVAAV